MTLHNPRVDVENVPLHTERMPTSEPPGRAADDDLDPKATPERRAAALRFRALLEERVRVFGLSSKRPSKDGKVFRDQEGFADASGILTRTEVNHASTARNAYGAIRWAKGIAAALETTIDDVVSWMDQTIDAPELLRRSRRLRLATPGATVTTLDRPLPAVVEEALALFRSQHEANDADVEEAILRYGRRFHAREIKDVTAEDIARSLTTILGGVKKDRAVLPGRLRRPLDHVVESADADAEPLDIGRAAATRKKRKKRP